MTWPPLRTCIHARCANQKKTINLVLLVNTLLHSHTHIHTRAWTIPRNLHRRASSLWLYKTCASWGTHSHTVCEIKTLSYALSRVCMFFFSSRFVIFVNSFLSYVLTISIQHNTQYAQLSSQDYYTYILYIYIPKNTLILYTRTYTTDTHTHTLVPWGLTNSDLFCVKEPTRRRAHI